ncbi:MAG: hypothetical protein ACYC5O_17545 [Anaerolineae bacterium]
MLALFALSRAYTGGSSDPRTLRWYRAATRWNEAYYCYRDGCVFIPGEGDAVRVSAMKELLYGE